MQLPGGLIEAGVRRRDYAFRPLSGALELALAEVAGTAANTPQAVTRALALALESLAGAAASPERVARLCVADRQLLMRELDGWLGHGEQWHAADCVRCGARFDFRLDERQLPVGAAGDAYPCATISVAGQPLAFRLPTGGDQQVIAGLPDPEARAWLLRELACDSAGRASVAEFDAATLEALDAALEAVAPQIVLSVSADCPECGQANAVELDPYAALGRNGEAILHEVHEIAAAYHWAEAEILGLPQRRRQRYLQMIAAARGLAS